MLQSNLLTRKVADKENTNQIQISAFCRVFIQRAVHLLTVFTNLPFDRHITEILVRHHDRVETI